MVSKNITDVSEHLHDLIILMNLIDHIQNNYTPYIKLEYSVY